MQDPPLLRRTGSRFWNSRPEFIQIIAPPSVHRHALRRAQENRQAAFPYITRGHTFPIRNLPSALAQADAAGVEARGVGRRHILVEVQNRAPTAEWLFGEGAAIAGYFESIGGVNPQIGIDRGPVGIDD